MFAEVLPANNFYREKLSGCRRQFSHWMNCQTSHGRQSLILLGTLILFLPKTERGVMSTMFVFIRRVAPADARFKFGDTQADWEWWMTCWEFIYSRACLQPGEPVFIAASFGPYIGFWSAFEGAVASGGRAIPSGGLSSIARLETATENRSKSTCSYSNVCPALGRSCKGAWIRHIQIDYPLHHRCW